MFLPNRSSPKLGSASADAYHTEPPPLALVGDIEYAFVMVNLARLVAGRT
jgi:hypothetical protein